MNIAVIGTTVPEAETFINQMLADVNCFSPAMSMTQSQGMQSIERNKVFDFQFVLNQVGCLSVKASPYEIDDITTKDMNSESSLSSLQAIMKYDNWVIMIDGSVFQEEEKKILHNIRKRYAIKLVPALSQYAGQHNQKPPNLFFVFSNADKHFPQDLNDYWHTRLTEYIKESFSGAMHEALDPFILLHGFPNIRTAGITFLSFLYLEQRSALAVSSNQLAVRNKQIELEIKQNRSQINSQMDKKIFKDKNEIARCEAKIQSLAAEQEKNKRSIATNGQDVFLNNVGIALNRLMTRSSQALISGFNLVCHPYNTSQYSFYPDDYWIRKFKSFSLFVSFIHLLFAIALMVWGIINQQNNEEQKQMGIIMVAQLGMSFMFMLFDYRNSDGVHGKVLKVASMGFACLGSYFAIQTCGWFIGGIAALCIILFHLWNVCRAGKVSLKWQAKRIKKRKIPLVYRFKDSLVEYYDSKLRMEVQNGK